MSDHTPGPWEARKSVVPHIENDSMVWDGDFIVWDGDAPIACVNCCDGIGEERAEKNANLIAAAPDMLEALETLLEEGDTNSTAVLCAEQAVAKAKGETE